MKNEMNDNTKALNHLIKVMYDSYEIDGNEISDTIHTFGELYDYRMLYNALWVNEVANKEGYKVFKSLKHEDGNYCFNKNGEWFIVVVVLPNGKVVDNHYETKYWDLFECQELEKSDIPYDGHTPNDVKNYMFDFLKAKGDK